MSKYATMSMFSGANQFTHLMEKNTKYCTLFGFTEKEIRETYGSHIEQHHAPLEATMRGLRSWYNGYRIHPDQADADMVYNPWSVLMFFDSDGQLQAHWAMTAVSFSVVSMLGRHCLAIATGFWISQFDLFKPVTAEHRFKSWQQIAFQVCVFRGDSWGSGDVMQCRGV